MRSRLLFLLVPLPLAFVAASFPACSAPPKLDDLCGWLGDPDNCYRQLTLDAPSRCGASGTEDPKTKGSFPVEQERSALESCILFNPSSGALYGSVTFDPPLDVTNLPIPTTTFTIRDNQAVQCGSGSVASNGGFSITFAPSPSVPEGVACIESETQYCGESFAFTPSAGNNFSVTCGSDSGFSFSTEQLASCDGTDQTNTGIEELKLDQLMPRAQLTIDPGSVGVEGKVALRVFYPLGTPTTGPNGKPNMTGTETTLIEYFDCAIPPAKTTCQNGVQDNGEKDVDCGLVCNKGCVDGTICQFPQDCLSFYCAPKGGALECQQNPECKDMMPNGQETDVDCGGLQCAKCANTLKCLVNSDCESGYCDPASKTCAAAPADAGAP